MRKVLVITATMNIDTGESTEVSSRWVDRPCSAPLFNDDRKEAGVCKSCSEGWSDPKNYPLDLSTNRELVPHYFKD